MKESLAILIARLENSVFNDDDFHNPLSLTWAFTVDLYRQIKTIFDEMMDECNYKLMNISQQFRYDLLLLPNYEQFLSMCFCMTEFIHMYKNTEDYPNNAQQIACVQKMQELTGNWHQVFSAYNLRNNHQVQVIHTSLTKLVKILLYSHMSTSNSPYRVESIDHQHSETDTRSMHTERDFGRIF